MKQTLIQKTGVFFSKAFVLHHVYHAAAMEDLLIALQRAWI